jgi:hypothetical protein
VAVTCTSTIGVSSSWPLNSATVPSTVTRLPTLTIGRNGDVAPVKMNRPE